MARVFGIIAVGLLLSGCETIPNVIVKPNTIVLTPHPVDCPEEPKIMIDPRSGEFMQSTTGVYVRDLREAHAVCRQSKLLQDKEIEELKKRATEKTD